MATPITPTPVLEGKNSKRFNEMLSADEQNKVPLSEKQRITSLVETILSKNKLAK